MKLNKITETGFYTCDLEGRETIYEVIKSYDGAEDIERVPRNINNNYCPKHIGDW